MRIAILSDIHSNIQALQKAFQFIDRSTVNQIYCLGDIVGYGANPNECVDLIRSRAALCVLGNHDLAALDPRHASYFTKPGRVAAEWTHTKLTKENSDYLASLPYTANTEHCTLVHASPAMPQEWEYINSVQKAEQQFCAFSTPICFIGHTHVPVLLGENLKTLVFKRGMRFLINVGSVGQPRDGNPQLSFGILDTELWSYRNIRLDYDIRGASQAIAENGLPSVLGKRLSQGH
jgi:predicted phosphodiesterase